MNNFIAISDARQNLPAIINNINKSLGRIVVTVQGQPKAAIISFEELESLEETAEILAISDAKKSIKKGLLDIKNKKITSLSNLV